MPKAHTVGLTAESGGVTFEVAIPVDADSPGAAIVKAMAHGVAVAAAQLGQPLAIADDTMREVTEGDAKARRPTFEGDDDGG